MKLSEVSNRIAARTRVLVKGKVDYSHIATKIAGKDLERANTYTNYPSKDPYFKMSVQITEPDAKRAFVFDPANESETALAAYLASRIYQSKKEENRGKKYFSAVSKGSEVRVYKKDEAGRLHRVDLNGNELAPGAAVEMELQFYENKFGGGVGLNAVVILDSEIKVFEGNFGVKGYDEIASDTITLPPRAASVAEDVTAANAMESETPVGEAGDTSVHVEEEPIGSSSAGSNDAFDELLKQFQAGGN